LSVRRQLVVNADDFGFTPDVNAGIVDAHRRGILTATTLMANGDAYDDAVRLARETPSLDIGCHLVLIGGRSLVTGNPFPATVAQLLAALARGRLRVYDELAAQVRRAAASGIRPTHLDTHKHTHLVPAVLDAVVRLARDFGIRWVRCPFDFPMNSLGAPRLARLANGAAGLMRGRFRRTLAAHGCRAVDHFAGFQLTGRLGAVELVALAAALPEGSTELMCHPGYLTDALRGAHTRLKESRQRELEALTAAETRRALKEHGIELISFAALG